MTRLTRKKREDDYFKVAIIFLTLLGCSIALAYYGDQHFREYRRLKLAVAEFQNPPAPSIAEIENLSIQVHCHAMRSAATAKERKHFARAVIEEADSIATRLSGDTEICTAQARSELNPKLAFKD